MNQLKPMPENAIIQVPAQAWNDIVEEIALLKKGAVTDRRAALRNELAILDVRREALRYELGQLETTAGLERTYEKRRR